MLEEQPEANTYTSVNIYIYRFLFRELEALPLVAFIPEAFPVS
jgi:hypothetical protein